MAIDGGGEWRRVSVAIWGGVGWGGGARGVRVGWGGGAWGWVGE